MSWFWRRNKTIGNVRPGDCVSPGPFHFGRNAFGDVEQRRSVDLTHQVNRRDSHAKRANYTLYHDKHGFSAAVKIAYKAKENRSEQTVDGVGFQIIVGVGDHFSLTGEDGGQQIAREKRDASHDKTGNQCCLDPIKQGFAGAFKFSGSVVLCHKGRNGLHIGGSYQHQKDADLLSNTNSSRFPNAHTVDHHLNKKKGKLNQQLLQGNGYTHQQNPLYASRIKPNVFFRKSKGQALFANKVKGNTTLIP